MKIKEILTIDLSEDITNVIDMENLQEEELLSEIENYEKRKIVFELN